LANGIYFIVVKEKKPICKVKIPITETRGADTSGLSLMVV